MDIKIVRVVVILISIFFKRMIKDQSKWEFNEGYNKTRKNPAAIDL